MDCKSSALRLHCVMISWTRMVEIWWVRLCWSTTPNSGRTISSRARCWTASVTTSTGTGSVGSAMKAAKASTKFTRSVVLNCLVCHCCFFVIIFKCLLGLDKITNEEVRARTKQYSIASTLGERWHCLSHVLWMDHQRISQQALHWEVQGFKRRPVRPRTNWRDVVKKDLQRMGLTWKEAEVAALDRSEWSRRVAYGSSHRHGMNQGHLPQWAPIGWYDLRYKVCWVGVFLRHW